VTLPREKESGYLSFSLSVSVSCNESIQSAYMLCNNQLRKAPLFHVSNVNVRYTAEEEYERCT